MQEKGEGIGFAGVGAKIYLASRDGSEILTVTSTSNNICYFYYDTQVPQEDKHLVYTVFGKRIINEPVDFDTR